MVSTLMLETLIERHYDNTNEDFTFNKLTYDINKCDITYMYLLLKAK